MAAGSAADNAFSFPQSIDPVQGNGCELGELGGQQSSAARVMLRLLPATDLEINLAADYTSQNDDPPVEAALTPRGGFDRQLPTATTSSSGSTAFATPATVASSRAIHTRTTPRYGDIVNGKILRPRCTDLDAWGTSATVDYNITDKVHAKFVGAYRTYDSNWISDSDLTPFGLIQTDYLQEHLQRQAELQVNGLLFADRLDWTTGVFFYNSKSRAYNTANFAAFNLLGILPNFVADDGYTSENKSAFVHVNYKFTDLFSVSAGLRYTDEEKTNTFNHIGQITVLDPLKFGDSRLDYNVGARLQGDRQSVLLWHGGERIPLARRESAHLHARAAAAGLRRRGHQLRARRQDRSVRPQACALNTAAFYMDYDPRLFSTLATQCNLASDPDPGTPFFLAGGTCPAGPPLAGHDGHQPVVRLHERPGHGEGLELEATAVPDGPPRDQLLVRLQLHEGRREPDARSASSTAPCSCSRSST